MSKVVTIQVRIEPELKEQVENLYKELGTSFSEAVRIFAKQSLLENGLPFVISKEKQSTFGRLSKYANSDLLSQEEHAFEKAMAEKHEENY